MSSTVGKQGFPKSVRLRKRREYLAVQNRGRKHHLSHLLAFVLPSSVLPSLGEPARNRFGITVSSKVGNAVTRNRVKRLLREVIRQLRWQIPEGLDVVFVAKKSAADASLEPLKRQFLELCRRLSRDVARASAPKDR